MFFRGLLSSTFIYFHLTSVKWFEPFRFDLTKHFPGFVSEEDSMAFSCVSCLHALLFPLVLRLMCFPFFKRNRLWTTVICWVLIKTDPQPAYKKRKSLVLCFFLSPNYMERSKLTMVLEQNMKCKSLHVQ